MTSELVGGVVSALQWRLAGHGRGLKRRVLSTSTPRTTGYLIWNVGCQANAGEYLPLS
jgi:hypothetical protein